MIEERFKKDVKELEQKLRGAIARDGSCPRDWIKQSYLNFIDVILAKEGPKRIDCRYCGFIDDEDSLYESLQEQRKLISEHV